MAISDVRICNLALAHIGAASVINSLDEKSKEAFHCNLMYEPVRDAVLREFPWNFATKYKRLALSGTPPSKWSYSYALPSDSLRVIEIVQPVAGGPPIEFELGVGDSLKNRYIYTNLSQAEVKYIARVTDPILFDTLFVSALSWRLAAEIAMPVTRDVKKQETARAVYERILSAAWTVDMAEFEGDATAEAEWITARG